VWPLPCPGRQPGGQATDIPPRDSDYLRAAESAHGHSRMMRTHSLLVSVCREKSR
jgi:hypothetical protein